MPATAKAIHRLPEPLCRICEHHGEVDPLDDDRIVTRLELVSLKIGPVKMRSWELVCSLHYRGGPFFWLSPATIEATVRQKSKTNRR